MSLIDLLRHSWRPSRIGAALLILACAAAAGDGIAPPAGGGTPGTGGKVTVKNDTKVKQHLTQVKLVAKNTEEPIETIIVDVIIEPGKTYEVQSSQFEEPVLNDSTMTPATLAPASSSQHFAPDTHSLPSLNWTLLYAGGTDISYGFNAASLLSSVPVPASQVILVLNGRDRSGHFPASVVFVDEGAQAPYTGSLVSAGQLSCHTGWSHPLFDGSGLTANSPQLEGSGDFASHGTLELRLSQAQPGALAVLVAGLNQIDVRVAGTGHGPLLVLPGLLVDENGGNLLVIPLGEVPAGLDVCLQEFVLGGAGGPAATNPLHAYSW